MENQDKNEVLSRAVKAGKRTYFFDVKRSRNEEMYLTITESKRHQEADGSVTYDKHKIFLYKEDFDKFREGLEEVIAYMKENLLKDIPERENDGWRSPEAPKTDVDFDEL